MRYLGGKERIADKIVSIINLYRNNETVLEPFCGGLSVTCRLGGNVIANDGFKPIITLYRELQKGWEPPDYVSYETWLKYYHNPDENDPMTAFVRIGCGFAGMYDSCYARDAKDSNYAIRAKKSLKRKLKGCEKVTFECKDYRDYTPENMVVYCDPPYAGTAGYAYGEFDSEEFWEIMRKWSENNKVFISEYTAPDDFDCIAEMPKRLGLRTTNGNELRTEKLFVKDKEKLNENSLFVL